MTQFKIGDRVRVKSYPDARYNGRLGTVTEFDARVTYPIRVNLDRPHIKVDDSRFLLALNEIELVPATKPVKNGTQAWMLLQHFLAGRTITRIQADHLYRIASLTRRIRDLRDAGHKVVSTRKVDPTGRPYVEYALRNAGRVAA